MLAFRRGRPRPSLVPALAFTLALVCTFAIAPAHAARGVVGPPILGVQWFTSPEVPCNGDDVRLLFTVCECPVDLVYAGLDSTNGLIHLVLEVQPDRVCITCRPDTFAVDLGKHAAGSFDRTVRFDIEYLSTPPDTTWPPSPAFGRVAYDVAPFCGSPTGVPYLDAVHIGRPEPCAGCPERACPGDSIDVFLRGTFPHDCLALADVELVPLPYAQPWRDQPLPMPPLVRVRYATASCLGRPCIEGPVPWSAHRRIPALPRLLDRDYVLPVEGRLFDVCIPRDSLGTFLGLDNFPFSIADSCSTQARDCVAAGWSRADRHDRCNAYYSPAHGAALTFEVGSTLPIAGVQGQLVLDATDAFRIADLAPLVPGWQIVQTRTAGPGLGFIAIPGPGGQPIPPGPLGTAVPLFSVRVEPMRSDLPAQARLAAASLLVADALGNAIPLCPTITLVDPPPTTALLCAEPRSCDANHDGATDVRDLVRMILCLNPPPNVRLDCPGPDVVDCEQDGDFDFDDVFCCARSMLGGPGGGGSDSLRRDAPEIAVGFGLPAPGPDGTLDVPLRFSGMGGVTAARVDVTYPEARYEVVGVSFTAAPPDWWTATHVTGGRIALAILDLGTALDATPPDGEATLRLRLRAGATAGGELAVATHDFAAADGATLVTPHADGSLALGSIGRVAMTAPRPNPFGAATSFAVTLPVAGPLDVAVFNSAGRRVTTLRREVRAAAGVYALDWNGLDEAGTRVAGGVYFVRVVAGGSETSRKLLFLPGGVR